MRIFILIVIVIGLGCWWGLRIIIRGFRQDALVTGANVSSFELVRVSIIMLYFLISKNKKALDAFGTKTDRVWRERSGYQGPSGVIADLRFGRNFEQELGKWPTVRQIGPSSYELIAAHQTPLRDHWPKRFGIATAFVVFYLVMITAMSRSDGQAVVICTIIGAIAGWVSTKTIWTRLCQAELKMTIEGGAARWKGPDGKPYVLRANEDFTSEVVPHRRGRSEERAVAQGMRSGKIGPKQTVIPVYVVASEVLMATGNHRQFRLPVAEIANDESGEQAHILKAAVDTVIDASREETEQHQISQIASSGSGRHYE